MLLRRKRDVRQKQKQNEADASEDVQYDEDGNVIENTDEDTDAGENEDVQYDEDGNVITDESGNTDGDNTDTAEDNADYYEGGETAADAS